MARPFMIDRTSAPDLFGPSSNGTPVAEDDRFADAENTFRKTEMREGALPTPGPQVAEFANALDKYTAVQGTPEEKRGQIFKFVDHLYSYSRSRAEALSDRRSRSRSRSAKVLPSIEGRAGRQESDDMDVDGGDDNNSVASRSQNHNDEAQRWENEAQTWDLLRRLLPLRYHDKTTSSDDAMATDNPLRTRKQYWEEFILSDSHARERKVVIEWLQTCANDKPSIDEVVSDFQRESDRGDILAHGWLHTRHKIKLQKSVNAYQGVLDPKDPFLAESHLSSDTLVTQLDPDAMTRQDRQLEPQDTAFEHAIWLGCFEMLKRGYTMGEVRDWCAERTESWRAASLSPLALSNPDDEDVEDFNPVFAVLWRRMCYATARDGGSNDYERAVYGILAGDIQSVEKIILTWEEHLFAHYNALIRAQFDAFLIKQAGAAAPTVAAQFPSFNAVQAHGDPTALSRRLIASLETNDKTKVQALTPAKALQGAMVANDLDRFLANQGAIIAKEANKKARSRLIPSLAGPLPEGAGAQPGKYVSIQDLDGVRVAAHVAIIISSLDRLLGGDDDSYSGPLKDRYSHQESIISAYIIMLRIYKMIDSVPLYCSKLHGDRVYTNLARNLINVTDEDERRNQLGLIEMLGLDVKRFALTGVREYLGDASEGLKDCEAKGKFKILQSRASTLKYGRYLQADFFGEDHDFVDEEDENIIRYLEWMMLVPGLFAEAVEYATETYVYLLKRMRLRAARSLATRVPIRSIFREKTEIALLSDEVDDELLDPTEWFNEVANSSVMDEIAEENGLQKEALVYAVKNLWELESMVRALDLIETLGSMAELMRTEGAGGKEFTLGVSRDTRSLKGFMKPVMKEWLTTGLVTDDFEALREAYIPEVVLAYISALHFAGTTATRDNLMECMELAAHIADQNSSVAKLFIKAARMQELLEAFASASKALAIWTGEKKSSAQSNTKKTRELGWSRELWSVRP